MSTNIKKIESIIVDILNLLGLEYTEIEQEITDEEGGTFYKYNIITDKPQLIIGHHGDVLFSTQQLVRLISKNFIEENESIIIDVDNYRKNQEANASEVAKSAVEKLQNTKLPVHLMNMPSYKRRAIHKALDIPEYDFVETSSEGEGKERHIVLKLKED
jgi:predicted RNA-binding protein Jag